MTPPLHARTDVNKEMEEVLTLTNCPSERRGRGCARQRERGERAKEPQKNEMVNNCHLPAAAAITVVVVPVTVVVVPVTVVVVPVTVAVVLVCVFEVEVRVTVVVVLSAHLLWHTSPFRFPFPFEVEIQLLSPMS
jgi:hypothetical protein